MSAARAGSDSPQPSPFVAGGRLPYARAWLRARPLLQGAVMAATTAPHRLPHAAAGTYFLLYHGVATDEVDGLRMQLQALLDRGPFLSWDEGLAALTQPPAAGPSFCLSFDDGHKEWLDRVLPLLHELNLTATFFITTDKVVEGTSGAQLTWDDCRELATAEGMTIGSHSVTHSRLRLLDEASARREVTLSKDQLEQHLGIPVLDFSAPYGLPDVDYTDRDLDLVAEAGYRSCASALPGRMSAGDSPFAVRRCGLSPAWPLMAVRRRVHE